MLGGKRIKRMTKRGLFIWMLLIALMFMSVLSYAADNDVKQVSCGEAYTGILKTDGTLWMCGNNSHGQLGDGTTENRQTPVRVMSDVAAVSCGNNYTGILKTDGTLWMCGDNDHGQLGDGTTKNRLTPVQVVSGVKAVSCGMNHTGIIKTDGTLWMCGDNGFGQLGKGHRSNVYVPVQVMSGVTEVSCGSDHTGILKNDGTLWMCGENWYGELGRAPSDHGEYIPSPVQVMSGVAAVSCGSDYSGILKKDGSLWMCGRNEAGRLTVSELCVYDPIQVMSDVAVVSCGGEHIGILKKDGTLWMCGRKNEGQLGTGYTTRVGDYTDVPVQMMSGVKVVSCGVYHTGILKNDGTLWMCGDNDCGQLGVGTTGDRFTPVQVKFSSSTPSQMSYTVTFNANGGAVTPSSKTVTNGNTYGNLPTPIRTNYKFDGWYTSSSGGTQVTSSTIVNLNADHILHAHWTYSTATTTTPTTSNTTTTPTTSNTTTTPTTSNTTTNKSVSGETGASGNELIFNTDCWNFKNPGEFKTKLTSTQMKQLKDACGTEEYFQALKDSFTNKKTGAKFDDEGNVVLTGGICYGMSCAVILNKMKSPFLSNNLNKESKNKFASILAFYQISQSLPQTLKNKIMSVREADAISIKKLERAAYAVEKGGTPVLFSFGCDGVGSHAVVAYGVENGSFTGAHGDIYDHRIQIYDCNNVKNKVAQLSNNYCFLYNQGSNKWEIPAYYDIYGFHSGKGYIARYLTDLEIMNPNGSAHNTSKVPKFVFDFILSNDTAVKMESGDWTASGSNMGLTSKTKDTVSFYAIDSAVDTEDLKLHVIPPNNISTLKVSTKSSSASDLDVQCLMKGAYHNINCDSAKSVTVNNDGTFIINGNKGNFDIRTTLSNGTTYIITGTSANSGDIKVVKKDKLVATGAKAVGVNITVKKTSDSNSKSYVVTSTKGYTVDASSKSLKKGSTFTAGKAKYKVTKAGVSCLAEAQYKTPKNKKYSTASIPNTVKYKGITYKVTSIAANAFLNVSSVQTVKIGANVKTIGKNAFSGCKKLKKVTGGKGVTNIGASVFSNCTSLASIAPGNNVTTIGAKAFYKCVALRKITIPAKVKKIGKSAFQGAKKLANITIKTTKLKASNVGSKAFSGINAKVKVLVPRKQLKAYKKLLKNKGLPKKAVVKGK